jgi:hypothetical protein
MIHYIYIISIFLFWYKSRNYLYKINKIEEKLIKFEREKNNLIQLKINECNIINNDLVKYLDTLPISWIVFQDCNNLVKISIKFKNRIIYRNAFIQFIIFIIIIIVIYFIYK